MSCDNYQISVATVDKLSIRYVAATSKRCPSCSTPFTHYHGHSCHHISPVGIKGGGCPNCHIHFCYACLSTADENIAERGDRKSCRCAKGKWGTFCESIEINRWDKDYGSQQYHVAVVGKCEGEGKVEKRRKEKEEKKRKETKRQGRVENRIK